MCSKKEENLMEKLRDYYMNDNTIRERPLPRNRPAADPQKEADSEIRRMKTDMEENRFCYIPPRVNVKQPDKYLHYNRKRDEGSFRYVAHADYYILLRSCSNVAQVDIRIMHNGVLGLGRRLTWLEKTIE